jgi:hypothetical protein
MDKHAYWDHPRFPNKPWNVNDFRIHNKSVFQDSGLGIIKPLTESGKAIMNLGFPYTVTEWNHCYPNQYAYETPLLLAATAQRENWDAVFQFAFSHGWDNQTAFEEIKSFFDILPNSQQLILCSYASYLFLRNQDIDLSFTDTSYKISTKGLVATVSSAPDSTGASILFNEKDTTNKSFKITTSEIKNQDSGWIDNRFKWGNKPILTRKVNF